MIFQEIIYLLEIIQFRVDKPWVSITNNQCSNLSSNHDIENGTLMSQ